MLYQYGPLRFATFPVSIKEYSRETSADFAWKDVIGGMKPGEAVGDGEDTYTLSCAVFPHRYGGLSEIEALHQIRLSQQEQILVRGDGYALGWRVITRLREKGTFVNIEGIGRCIEVEIELRRVPPPSGGAVLGLLTTLLGGL